MRSLQLQTLFENETLIPCYTTDIDPKVLNNRYCMVYQTTTYAQITSWASNCCWEANKSNVRSINVWKLELVWPYIMWTEALYSSPIKSFPTCVLCIVWIHQCQKQCVVSNNTRTCPISLNFNKYSKITNSSLFMI